MGLILKVTALYLAQALFWAWIGREAWRDRPKGARPDDKSAAVSLWRFDANVWRGTSLTMLVVTTLGYIILVVVLIVARLLA